MKKKSASITLLFIALTFWSCSNEINVIGVWKDIPVVYGVIYQQKDTNYIRIERTYLPPNQSAYEAGQNPDSIYYDPNDIIVTLASVDSRNGNVNYLDTLERVNLTDLGMPRDSGLFASDPNYAYLVDWQTSLNYRLQIYNVKTRQTYGAITPTVDASDITLDFTPSYNHVSRWVAFVKKEGNDYVMNDLGFSFYGDKDFAGLLDYIIRFQYEEYEVTASGVEVQGTRVQKTLDWKAVKSREVMSDNIGTQTISSASFFEYLKATIPEVSNTTTRRCAKGVELMMDGASNSLRDYYMSLSAFSSTQSGVNPADVYTNVSDGFGVLATAVRIERKDRAIDPRMMRLEPAVHEYLRFSPLFEKHAFSGDNCY